MVLERETTTTNSVALYLAIVCSIRSPPGYGFEYRTIIKDSIYIGLLDQAKLTGRVNYSLRLHDPQCVSFDVIRNWLDRCDSHKICSNIAPISGNRLNLKVLDIEHLQVVHSPEGSLYIALSYVLGKTPSIRQRTTYTLSDFPRFYQDAIAVVRALNHRYIWTDYICIDNTNTTQRALEIERMGTIYRQA